MCHTRINPLGKPPIRQEFLDETQKLGLQLDPFMEVKDPALGAIRLAISALRTTNLG